jgi:hypothetical protein
MSDRVPAYSLAGETFVERIERGLALDRVFRRDPEQSIASSSHPGCRNFRRARGPSQAWHWRLSRRRSTEFVNQLFVRANAKDDDAAKAVPKELAKIIRTS